MKKRLFLLEKNIIMNYTNYLAEIKERKNLGLNPKPIDEAELLSEIISQIKDINNLNRKDSLKFFIYNTIPGTTPAATVKAKFLKEIIQNEIQVVEISTEFAFELLSHMKGGPSVKVLLDLALGNKKTIAIKAAEILKSQVFLYEADTERLEKSFNENNKLAKEILESYAKAEFFTKLPELDKEINLVTYVAGVGDISTDLLSPGSDAHSRSDRELHGKCMFEHNTNQQNELLDLQKKHPDKTVMLLAEKGTMGVGSSRMSGINNVSLWIGKQASPYVPFINIAPVVAGTNGISPIFLTTVDVTGGIGLDLKNWKKKKDSNGNTIISIGSGSKFLIDNGIVNEKLLKSDKDEDRKDYQPYIDAQDNRGKERIGGIILNAHVDLTHPIGFGYEDSNIPVYRNNTVWIQPSDNEYSSVVRYTNDPLIDGFITDNNAEKLNSTISLLVSKIGNGRAVLFSDNPNFRGSWYGTNRLFLNAILLGDKIQVP